VEGEGCDARVEGACVKCVMQNSGKVSEVCEKRNEGFFVAFRGRGGRAGEVDYGGSGMGFVEPGMEFVVP